MTVRILSYLVDGRIGARSKEAIGAAVDAIRRGDIDVVSGQGTGMDAGPYYLGSGDVLPPTRGDIEPIVLAAKEKGIPFIFSMGGTAGADVHLKPYLELLDVICEERRIQLRVGVISGEIAKEYLKEKVRSGVQMPRLFDTPRLSEVLDEAEIDRAERIQAQMGPEPIMEAFRRFPDIDGVITGRALDVGIHMAYPLMNGVDRATAAHAGKVIECSSMACEPATPFDFVIAEIDGDEFTVRPSNPQLRCTVKSVAGHALYERENPAEEKNPGGVLDVSDAEYIPVDDRTVLCKGGQWVDSPYTVKLEGVERVGHQFINLFAIRDEIAIQHIDQMLAGAIDYLSTMADPSEYEVYYHVFGRDGILGKSEPLRDRIPHEIAVLTKVIAKDIHLAERLAHTLRIRIFLSPYPGRRTTAGSVAFPLQHRVMPTGDVYKFSVWHLLPLDDPCEPFQPKLVEFPRKPADIDERGI